MQRFSRIKGLGFPTVPTVAASKSGTTALGIVGLRPGKMNSHVNLEQNLVIEQLGQSGLQLLIFFEILPESSRSNDLCRILQNVLVGQTANG